MTYIEHTERDRIARWARLLGYAGLLPLIAAMAGAAFGDGSTSPLASLVFTTYAAIVLTFIGATHWGMALRCIDTGLAARALVVSVQPALLGWVAILLPPAISLPMLLGGFVLLYFYERYWLWTSLFPRWYQGLRTQLSIAVIVMILVMYRVVA